MPQLAVCLMGPTAAGKTDLAIRLCKRFPFDVISVDSAMVYRGMDIGTSKPDARTLARVPHRLIDIREPEQRYSAGDFVRDAAIEIADIAAAGRIPLLVGGTMLYFRALTQGLSELPPADPALRRRIDVEAGQLGWPALHAQLAGIDARSAARIDRNDSQRIQRALEVYYASGQTLSDWHAHTGRMAGPADIEFVTLAVIPGDRQILYERIEKRLKSMINSGFIEEVRRLYERPGLSRRAPSMRAVGYRQLWAHVAGECPLAAAVEKARAATRQLAKRQLTWLRGIAGLDVFDPLEASAFGAVSQHLAQRIFR